MDLEKPFYTVSEIAKRWACSPDKVSRVFRGRPGVMDLGTGRTAAKGRRYSILRIPQAVLRAAEEEMMRSCASRSN